MHNIEANEIVGTTFYTINTILEQGYNGPDALALYFKYIEQTRIQQTNITRSLDSFMKKKTGWGDSRFKKAKKILKDLGSIDLIQKRDSLGRIKTVYVRVNFLINENKIRKNSMTYEIEPSSADIQSVDIPPNGERERNALSTKYKCLKDKKEIHGFGKNPSASSQNLDQGGEAVQKKKRKIPQKEKKKVDWASHGFSEEVIKYINDYDSCKKKHFDSFEKAGITSFVNKLKRFGGDDVGMTDVLETSMANGWEGIYAPTGKKKDWTPQTEDQWINEFEKLCDNRGEAFKRKYGVDKYREIKNIYKQIGIEKVLSEARKQKG